jgi:hypothetical protein
MKNTIPNVADLATPGAVLALVSAHASAALKGLVPGKIDVAAALDTAYGKGKWFLFWDEDLRGRPIRGTISLAFGKQTLIVG